MRKVFAFALLTMGVLLMASPVFAQEAAAGGGHQWATITAGFAMAIASSMGLGGSIGFGASLEPILSRTAPSMRRLRASLRRR